MDKPSDAITGKKPESSALDQSTLGANGQDEFSTGPTKKVPDTHPPAIWFFFWGEFAERSSYYGMRAILFLYLTAALGMSDPDATRTYSVFKMACYFLPLLGGIIADQWLGRYWTIVGFSIPYVVGHFILGIPNEIALVIALALLAGGSGVIKPNISTLMGQTYDLKRPGKEQLRSAAFLWFYFAINIGALISQLAMPRLRTAFGYSVAFQFPAWLMVISLTVFALGKPFYAPEAIGNPWKRLVALLQKFWRAIINPVETFEWLVQSLRALGPTLGPLFAIFGLVILFWVGYEHNDTLWIAFARDYVELKIPFTDIAIEPDQLQFLNALFVIILVPTFNFVFAKIDPDVKIITPMRKVFVGFLLTAASIGIMSAAGYLAQGHTQIVFKSWWQPVEESTVKVSVLWPSAAYIVLTFGEVLLYGTMLELAYSAAPKNMKGMITACFLVTNTLGNFVNILWAPNYGGSLTGAKSGSIPPGQFFAITALMVVAAAIAFLYVGRWFERSVRSRPETPTEGLPA